jgi:hypothetical protein
MAGKKTFVAGEVLLAQDVNDYLMDQTVMTFASSAARSSAIPTPTEGMTSYRTDANFVDIYDGSLWQPAVSVAAWIPFTPTLNNITLGNGTVDFAYAQIGKTVHVRFLLTVGTTTSIGTNANFNLPVGNGGTPNATYTVTYLDNGSAFYTGVIFLSGNGANFWLTNVGATYPTVGSVTANTPFTWANLDQLSGVFTYQAG